MKKDELHRLELIDGLPSTIGAQKVFYKTVELRETNVNDEMLAVQMAERVVMMNNKPTLLLSDEVYRVAMTARHVSKFSSAGLPDIDQDLVDLRLFGKLSPFDLQRIEERVLLITMAAQVRYGLMSAADFDAILAGEKKQPGAAGPRPEGHPTAVAAGDADAGDGPTLLADFAERTA